MLDLAWLLIFNKVFDIRRKPGGFKQESNVNPGNMMFCILYLHQNHGKLSLLFGSINKFYMPYKLFYRCMECVHYSLVRLVKYAQC